MANFTVTASELRRVGDNLMNLNGLFQQQVGKLMQHEEELDARWDGQANDAFKVQFASNCESLNSFYTVIGEYIQMLESVATIYDTKEQQAIDIANN